MLVCLVPYILRRPASSARLNMHVNLQGIYWHSSLSCLFLQLLQVAACGRGQVVSCLRLHRRQQVNYALSLSLSSPRFAACGATSGSPDATSDAPKEIKNVAAKKKTRPVKSAL